MTIRRALLPLAFVANVGMITFGACVGAKKPWWTLAVAMGIAGFGLQIGTVHSLMTLVASMLTRR